MRKARRSLATTLIGAVAVTLVATAMSAVFKALATVKVCGLEGQCTEGTVRFIGGVPVLGNSVVVNVSLFLLFVALNVPRNCAAIIVSRVAFYLPCIVLDIVPQLGRVGPGLCRTTLSLNTSPVRTLHGIVVPRVLPNVVSKFVLTVAVDVSSFTIAVFAVKGRKLRALSAFVCTSTEGKNLAPRLHPLDAVVFMLILIVLVVVGHHSSGGGGGWR